MVSILFVCHGNICRSPMAEFVMKDKVRRAGLEDQFEIDSAATSTEEIGNPVYPPVREVLRNHGVPYGNRVARQMDADDYVCYDHIICMDGNNMRNLGRICKGDPDRKVGLLMDLTDRPGDVADPWYTRDFETAWADIDKGCQSILDFILRGDIR